MLPPWGRSTQFGLHPEGRNVQARSEPVQNLAIFEAPTVIHLPPPLSASPMRDFRTDETSTRGGDTLTFPHPLTDFASLLRVFEELSPPGTIRPQSSFTLSKHLSVLGYLSQMACVISHRCHGSLPEPSGTVPLYSSKKTFIVKWSSFKGG